MKKVIDWVLGRHEHDISYDLSIAIAELDDAIYELAKAIKEVREDVDYLTEFLGIDD
jgi:hypothetical protein